MRKIILLVTLLAMAVMSKAETLIGSEGLRLIPALAVEIYDSTEDDCWTNVESVEASVRSILLRSDIEVIDDEDSGGANLQMHFVASRRDGICFGAYAMSVEVLGVAYFLQEQTIFGGMDLEESFGWFVGLPNGNKQILETAQEYARSIAHKILTRRAENN